MRNRLILIVPTKLRRSGSSLRCMTTLLSSTLTMQPKMNCRKNERRPAQPIRDMTRQIGHASSSEEERKVESYPVSNWAWTTAHLHYDWMDLHAPFACLD